jgi:2-polyprenyl-6-hydroxyphenyl methylase/3-demethylubiquinone-9 3-methyltransferase
MKIDEQINIDPTELERFTRLADEWWNPDGQFRPVHKFNLVRLAAIENWIAGNFGRDVSSSAPFADIRILDVGCGAGLMSEPLARLGATLVGLDATPRNVEIARWHAAQNGLDIDYRNSLANRLVEDQERFDVVLNLEVVEHVPDPHQLIKECSALVKPGGIIVIATISRTLRSYLFAIIGAEHILRWLPKGTHRWSRFLRPEEVSQSIEQHGYEIIDVTGVSFSPTRSRWALSTDIGVNYMTLARRPK